MKDSVVTPDYWKCDQFKLIQFSTINQSSMREVEVLVAIDFSSLCEIHRHPQVSWEM